MENLINKTIKFFYNGVERTVAVEKVIKHKELENTFIVTGRDAARDGAYRSFNLKWDILKSIEV